MTESCAMCDGPVNRYDEGTYKEVVGWVHGKKSDAMTLRDDTGRVAHEKCVLKAKAGVAPDQPDLFGEDTLPPTRHDKPEPPNLYEFVDELVPEPTNTSLGEVLVLQKPWSPKEGEEELPF